MAGSFDADQIAVTMDRYGQLMDGLDDQVAVHPDAPSPTCRGPKRAQANKDPPSIGL